MLDLVPLSTSQILLGGENPFLLICKGGRYSVEKFEIVLQRGASVHDRDSDGNTCLHLCVWLDDQLDHSEVIGARDGQIYLIQRGADPFAENLYGDSVSQEAYDKLSSVHAPLHIQRLSEDVWDCVLANCGYDIDDFRTRPRRAVYTKHYTRAHFEQLWEGCEHLCPYYEDEEDAVYLTDSSEDLEDDDKDGGSGCEHGNGDLEEDEDDWSDSEDGGVGLGPGNETAANS
ncbi:ankyrin repeat domain-containing protein [Candidatus Bathyarchaeota archaeon]|nr:ankyrin repeat domain-containing protein [Candidatus Bathyarchaeota archaeon]